MIMKIPRLFKAGTFFALFLLLAITTNAQTYVAKLTGAQEALPVATRANGTVTATLTGNQLEVTGSFAGLESNFDPNIAGGAHLHFGLIGQNGPIAFNLTTSVNLDQKSGSFLASLNTFTLSAPEIVALQNHGIYINIHTVGNQGGELRGQLVPQGSDVYTINMFGSNEVPSIISDAHGAMLLEVNGTSMRVSGAFEGLESDFDATIADGAHLHNGLAGQNGPVEIILDATVDAGMRSGVFTTTDNTYTLSSAQMTLLENRQMYVNIHTVEQQAGELRGNVTANPNSVWRAHLAGYNEVPVVTSTGHGEVILELNGNVLTAHGSFGELSSPFDPNVAGGAHIHMGYAGQTGGVLAALTSQLVTGNLEGSFAASANSWTLTAGQVDTLFERMLYVNLHSEANQPGEIRGQVLQEGSYFFNAFLSGNFEVPSLLTNGEGFLTGEVLGDRLIVTGSFASLDSPFDPTVAGGAHLHTGYAGQTGGVAASLTATPDGDDLGGVFTLEDNTVTLDSASKVALRWRQLYANIHTEANQAGELRGQMLHEATAYFVGTLTGGQQAAPHQTNGWGGIAAEVAGDQLMLTGSFSDLESDFDAALAGGSHLHNGLAGAEGGIALLLNADVEADNRNGVYEVMDNTFTVSEGMLDTIMDRWTYVNIHTLDASAGALRAQLMPLANSYLYTHLNGWHAIDPTTSSATGGLIAERVQDMLTVSGWFNGTDSIVDTNIVGGVHLHSGTAGTSGDVEFVISTDFETGMTGGSFWASDNTFSMTGTQMEALMDEGLYLNIHTVGFGTGELRGQLLNDYNNAPDMATLTMPSPSTVIDIDTSATSTFVAQWSSVTDPNDNEVAYVWQLALDSAFTQIVYAENVGTSTQFSTTHQNINWWLGENGVMEGDTAQVYHRVVATDGSMEGVGELWPVQLHRSVITGLEDVAEATVSLYPNPASDVINVQWSGAQVDQVQLMDLTGRTVQNQQIANASAGVLQLGVEALPAGTYIMTVTGNDGQMVKQSRVVVR